MLKNRIAAHLQVAQPVGGRGGLFPTFFCRRLIDAYCCLVSGARTVRTPALKKALLLTILVMAAAPALAEDAMPAQAAEPRHAENQRETHTETNGTAVASPSSAPETMCDTLAAVAERHELPADFFIRLIWQESRFNPSAVSFKGAQGIAQFMIRLARRP